MSVQCQNYLSHYGIKNQKWGIRRFQNEDGSYTAEGKERYGRSTSSGSGNGAVRNGRHAKAVKDLDEVLDSKDPRVKNSFTEKDRKDLLNYRNKLAAKDNIPLRGIGSPAKGVMKGQNKRDWKPKDAESLSDDELNKRNSRLQREEQYRNATTPKWKKEVQQTSKDWVKEAAKKIFVAGAVALAATAMRKHYADAFDYIGKKANVKVASMRAAHILKKEVSRRNYFDNRGPDILGKHTGRR